MDKLASMQVFVQVVETGGFSAAADVAGISPTMVGKHIRQLEERLGARLLNRTTRKQSLTEIGAIYYERCKHALAAIEGAEASVNEMQIKPRGVLKISVPISFGAQVLSSAIGAYLQSHPDIRIDLSLNNRIVDLVEEGFEAAIRIGSLPDSSLIARALAPYRMVVCASPDYLQRCGTPVVPQDLREHNCLGFADSSQPNKWRFRRRDKVQLIEVQGNLQINNGAALRNAAMHGIGIIMQPEVLLSDDLANGKLARLLQDYELPSQSMHLVYSSNRNMTPKLKLFVDFIVDRFGSRGSDAQRESAKGDATGDRSSVTGPLLKNF